MQMQALKRLFVPQPVSQHTRSTKWREIQSLEEAICTAVSRSVRLQYKMKGNTIIEEAICTAVSRSVRLQYKMKENTTAGELNCTVAGNVGLYGTNSRKFCLHQIPEA